MTPTRLANVYLYDEPDAPRLDIEDIGRFIASQFPGTAVIPRTDFFTHQFARFTREQRTTLETEVLKQLQRIQVKNFDPPGISDGEPAPEVEQLGVVLVASGYQEILRLLIDPAENTPDCLHIVFTDSLIGHWPEGDRPFALEVMRLGNPAIISTSGLVEALPRPREYEFKRAQFAMFGLGEESLEDLAEEFADRTFGYGDPRINEVCKGYALMACFDRVFGEGSCADRSCRLYHPQTQEELIRTQCGPQVRLCQRHQQMLESLRQTPDGAVFSAT